MIGHYLIKVQANKRGDKFIRLPHQVRQSMGIKRGDIIEATTCDESIFLRFRAPQGSKKPKRSSKPYFPQFTYRAK